ncbi:hypothetical protein E3P84_01675 [Wallemia ichthyophaga]|nr:hypothetical protein E3P84_01675 [Wallemia ichthyophaga]TIB41833.1 hypothetical protein E3P83_01624 [Wallemia ichthyophaga]
MTTPSNQITEFVERYNAAQGQEHSQTQSHPPHQSPAINLAQQLKSHSTQHPLTDADVAYLSAQLHPLHHPGVFMYTTTLYTRQLLSDLANTQGTNTHTNTSIASQYHSSQHHAHNTPTAHLRVWGEVVVELSEQLHALAKLIGSVKSSLPALHSLLYSLTGGAVNELTGVHRVFTQACIDAHMPTYAMGVVEGALALSSSSSSSNCSLEIPSYTPLTCNDALAFLANAATALLMLGRFEQALFTLQMVLAMPLSTSSSSAAPSTCSSSCIPPALLDAAKRSLLTQLIVYGTITPFPKHCGGVERALKKTAPAFHSLLEISIGERDKERDSLAQSQSQLQSQSQSLSQPHTLSFNSRSHTTMLYLEVLRKNSTAFASEGGVSEAANETEAAHLARLAQDSLWASLVACYADVYSSIPVAHLAAELGEYGEHAHMREDMHTDTHPHSHTSSLSPFLQRIASAIALGRVQARIDGVAQVVHFDVGEKSETNTKSDEKLVGSRLESAIKHSLIAQQHVLALDRHLALHPLFVKHHIAKTEQGERRRRDKEGDEDGEQENEKDKDSDEMVLSEGDE